MGTLFERAKPAVTEAVLQAAVDGSWQSLAEVRARVWSGPDEEDRLLGWVMGQVKAGAFEVRGGWDATFEVRRKG